MTKKVIVDLDKDGIDMFLSKLKNFNKKLDNSQKEIVNDLAQYAMKEMQTVYNNSNVEDSTPMSFDVIGNDYEKQARMAGFQAIYDEFGTGTIGEMNPHRAKGNFELNPYNSGETIRTNKSENSRASLEGIPVGGLYWTYRDSQGNKKYTQGIAAQKEGYTAFQKTSKKATSVARKRIQEVLNDFN